LFYSKLARPPHQKHYQVRGDSFDFDSFNAKQFSSWGHSFDFGPFNANHILGRVLLPKAFLMGSALLFPCYHKLT